MQHHTFDPHAQLRSLYQSLLGDQAIFDEFKYLLSLYPVDVDEGDRETAAAAEVRSRINDRVRAWTHQPSGGLSSVQIAQWRAILVDERANIALCPWKEANGY
jgi:hypothetical protein